MMKRGRGRGALETWFGPFIFPRIKDLSRSRGEALGRCCDCATARGSLPAGLASSTEVPPKPRSGPPGDWSRALREAAPYLGIGSTFAIAVALGVAGGYWLDGRLGTEPLFLILGGVAGLGVAFVEFFKMVGGKKR